MDVARKQRVLSKVAGILDRLTGADEVQKSIAGAKKNYEEGGTFAQQVVNREAATQPAGAYYQQLRTTRDEVADATKRGNFNREFGRNMVGNANNRLAAMERNFSREELERPPAPGHDHLVNWKTLPFGRNVWKR